MDNPDHPYTSRIKMNVEGGRRTAVTKEALFTTDSSGFLTDGGSPLVSVITVVRNGVTVIRTCIESVLSQSLPNVEHIVVDGGSTDGTVDVLESFDSQIEYWVSRSDEGIYPAMNEGLKLAQGMYVLFLNADDRLHPDALRLSCEALSRSTADFCFGSVRLTENEQPFAIKHPLSPLSLTLAVRHMICSHQSMVVRRSVLESVGGFDARYRLVADQDLFCRMIAAGHSGIQIDQVLGDVEVGGASDSFATIVERYRLARNYRVPKREALLLASHSAMRFAVRKVLPILLQRRVSKALGLKHQWL